MKKNFYYAMISAALLTGAAGFSACSSDDVVIEVNPSLSADGKEVKTQFALNIPREKSGRMTGATTQQDGTSFRGMEGIKLIPLTTEGYTGSGDAHVMISLKNIGTNDEDFKDRVKVYSDVSIPVGTKGFLFYGHAAEGTHVNPTQKDNLHKFDLGKLVPKNLEVNQAPSSYEFALEKVYSGTATSTEQAQAILTALNAIAAVEGWADDKELGELYKKFTTDLKAGSANSVLAAVQSLYDNVANYGDNTIGGKIKNAITTNFNVKGEKVAWKTENSFPTNLNLPEGSVALTFSNKEFAYGNKDVIGGTSNVSVSSITFPASLYYMANTGVKANSSPTATWPTLEQWPNSTTWENWGAEVVAATRKIALANTVNYAVSQLVTTFTCEAETLPAKTITINENEIKQFVTVNTKEGGFPVTGLLIGGQPTKVNYDFQPASTDGFTNTVYDNAIGDAVKANVKKEGENPTANYTLLLSNWKGETEKTQNNVNFAVELKNNSGQAFQGADGLVPVDGTFYLIGTLKPENNKNQNIEGVKNPSVFMRDYKTTARINITTLATAYNTIPDLRATNLELGLAVDLTWKKGMDFDVNIGEE